VNDQIWSNTRFRICLKVLDRSDSNEMIKKPDAASIVQPADAMSRSAMMRYMNWYSQVGAERHMYPVTR
jgi:S-DNA-T family DNA segregation ATPase FtsK/SpoIIIE